MATAVTTSIREQKPDGFEPRTISFPDDEKLAINHFLEKHISSRLARLKNIHTSMLPKWRRIANGEPLQNKRSFPFDGASNLVHQLVGEAIDDLAARVLQLVWMTAPIIYFRYFLSGVKPQEVEKYTRRAKELMQFVDYAAYEHRELNLYPRENKWWINGAREGRSWIVVAPEERIESVYIGYKTEDKKRKPMFDNKTLYEGPKLINARYEDILYDPDVDVFEETDPLFRRCTLTLRKLRERIQQGTYIKEEADKILSHPDRYGPDENKRRENQKKGVTDTQDDTLAEWDIYEAYFSWWHDGKKFRLIAWYHQRTKTLLNCVYNFIPDNQIPIIETRLTADGRGFSEILEHNQDEVSTAKNQRNDSITVSMMGINTVDPQNKTLGPNFRYAPNIFLPVKKDSFMHYDVGNAAFAGLSLENERAMIQQAKERAGVGPAITGMGAGTTNKKGQYSAMGTLSMMQDGNSRNDHRTSDFRHSHVALLAMVTDFYGFLGLGRKASTFGLDDEILKDALQDYLDRKMRIPIRAATASLNREVTKQNQVILNQMISAYIKETSSQLQAIMSGAQTLPPEYLKWLLAVTQTKTRLVQQIVKDFQITDNPTEYIPDIDFKLPEQGPPNAEAQQTGNVSPISPMAAAIQRPGEGGIPFPGSGMGSIPSGPPVAGH